MEIVACNHLSVLDRSPFGLASFPPSFAHSLPPVCHHSLCFDSSCAASANTAGEAFAPILKHLSSCKCSQGEMADIRSVPFAKASLEHLEHQ